jgi:hypothetical protein
MERDRRMKPSNQIATGDREKKIETTQEINMGKEIRGRRNSGSD